MKVKTLLALVLFFGLVGCKVNKNKPVSNNGLSYLALGDSYTIGESVPESGQWPIQLVKALNEDGFLFSEPKIIAKTGWRTDHLLHAMKNEPAKKQYDLVSVLIGVNNQYQGIAIEQFKKELNTTLEQAILYAKNGKNGVFMLSIPDYGVTPFGLNSGKENIGKELKMYNKLGKEIAQSHNIPFYNITDISLKAEKDATLLASDGLHPSEEMYRLWVAKILPQVKKLLRN